MIPRHATGDLHRGRQLAAWFLAAWFLAAAGLVGQSPQQPGRTPPGAPPATDPASPDASPGPQQPEPDPVAQEAQRLIDAFLAAMPRDPSDLRRPELRAALTGSALPAVRAVCSFVEQNPDAGIAARGLEFDVYALVLDDRPRRRALEQRADRELSARLLLGAADVITAAEGEARQAALTDFAGAFEALRASVPGRATPAGETGPPTDRPSGDPTAEPIPGDPRAPSCAANCVVLAAGLTEAEARQLAEAAGETEVGRRFARAAEAASRSPSRLVGQRFDVEGTLLGGQPFALSSLRGKVVVVDFWASWCVPCVRALPEIVAVRERFADAGLVVVGISSDHDRSRLEAFLEEHPEVDWPQLVAPDLERGTFHPLAVRAGVTSIPRVFLIDRDGVVRSVDAMADLEAGIAEALAR